MAVETPANRNYLVAAPPLFPPLHRLRSSVKSERHSPPHDLSLPTLPDFSFHSQPSRFGMPPPHASDGWNFKRSGPGIPVDLGDMSYTDEYDDADDIGELPSNSGSSHAGHTEKVVRRRSSKGVFLATLLRLPDHLRAACDQCRKSKCKCERAGDGSACKNCMMLGTGMYLVPFINLVVSSHMSAGIVSSHVNSLPLRRHSHRTGVI